MSHFNEIDLEIETKIFNNTPYLSPKYSTNITEAMKIIDKLRNSGEFCCLKMDSDYHYLWTVSLTYSEDLRPNGRGSNSVHTTDIIINHESLPMAICLAALNTIKD